MAAFNMENQQGPAGQPREVCSMSRGSWDGRGVGGRKDACICKAESLCCPPETITTLLIVYAPIIKTLQLEKKIKESALQCRRRGFDPWLGNEDRMRHRES